MRRFPILVLLLGMAPTTAVSAQDAPKWYDRVRFDGDFRLRHETFIQQDTDTRGRMRIRLRAGFTVPLSEQFTTGFRLASSEPGAVTSHNVSLTGGLTSKNFFVDRAFLTWTPSTRFTVTGGKFANPLQRAAGLMRSELIFDDEVAPEGLHEQLTLVSRTSGTVRRVALLGEQWSLQEASVGPDSWFLGGQLAVDLAPSARTTVNLLGGYYGYLHGRPLAAARNGNSALLVSNAVVLQDGTIAPGGRPYSPSASNPIRAFANDFELLSASAGLSVDRAVGRMPLQLYVDVVHNAGAEDAQDGWWSGVTLGALRARGDWAASVVWTRVEREAVVSMYSYSDLGVGGTNVKGPILTLQYRPVRELSLSFRHHLITPVEVVSGQSGATLHRIMLDAAVSF